MYVFAPWFLSKRDNFQIDSGILTAWNTLVWCKRGIE